MSTVPSTRPASGATPVAGVMADGATAASTARIDAITREVPATRRPGWWGMALFLGADASIFASMIGAYYYIEFVTSNVWPPPGDPNPKLLKASILTALLVVSVFPLLFADTGLRRGSRARLLVGGTITGLLGAAFVVLEVYEFMDELTTSWPTKDAYGSLFYMILGFHLGHIMLATLAILGLVLAAAMGRVDREHHIIIRVFGLFWYVSVAIWVIVYLVLYWSVRV